MPPNACNSQQRVFLAWRSRSKSGFLGCQSSQFQGNFGKRWFKLCTWFWVCNILDLPFWIPCCILCVALSTPMKILGVTAMLLVYEDCFMISFQEKNAIFCSIAWQSHTFSRWGFVFGRQPDARLFVGKRFSWTEVFSCLTMLGVLFLNPKS